VSSARFILLLLLLASILFSLITPSLASSLTAPLHCLSLSTVALTAPTSAARRLLVFLAARPLRSGSPAGVRLGSNQLLIPSNPKHFHTLHGKAQALCYPSTPRSYHSIPVPILVLVLVTMANQRSRLYFHPHPLHSSLLISHHAEALWLGLAGRSPPS
jgi:hypothetical protein